MKNHLSNVILFLILIEIIFLNSCNKLDFTSKKDLSNTTDSLSYYLGIYTGWTLKEAGFEDLDKAVFDSALYKVFNATDTNRMEYAKADQIIAWYIQKGRNDKTLEQGRRFLAENKEQEGIITTESGLQYLPLRKGKGLKPQLGDSVVIRFTGYTLEGEVFMNMNSNTGEPYKMLLKNGTKGGLEALQLMQEGAKCKFFLPTELAYGLDPLPGSILKPNMAIIYEIELLSVVPAKK